MEYSFASVCCVYVSPQLFVTNNTLNESEEDLRVREDVS